MKKILSVFGTRPEAIKMAPLVKLLAADSRFDSRVAVTAQHREMLDQVLELFKITPDYDLDLMKLNQDLSDITSRVLLGLREVFKDFHPDIILVHGDTTTTFSAALAGFYQKIPIGHVEAGLRTGNLYSPWPEEANRLMTSRLATLHFAPTKRNYEALVAENIPSQTIMITGNTVIDSLKWMVGEIEKSSDLKRKIEEELKQSGLNLRVLKEKYILITGHRRENLGEGFENICNSLGHLAEKNKTIHFIYPVHLNPQVQEPVKRLLSGYENIHLIKPLGYEAFIYLMKKCYLVLTDSGGVQEEAPGLGKPVLVMRDTTERPEAIEAGTVKLVGVTTDVIVNSVQRLLDDHLLYEKMSQASNPYGDGKACERIVNSLAEFDSFKV